MAMELYLLRHGIAAEPTLAGGDAERPLTAVGIERVREVARALCVLNVLPDVLLTSPYRRAAATADIVGRALGVPPVVDERLACGSDASALLMIPREHRSAAVVMCVGHEPELSDLTRSLTGARIQLKKAGLVRIDLAVPASSFGVLTWMLQPRILREIGR